MSAATTWRRSSNTRLGSLASALLHSCPHVSSPRTSQPYLYYHIRASRRKVDGRSSLFLSKRLQAPSQPVESTTDVGGHGRVALEGKKNKQQTTHAAPNKPKSRNSYPSLPRRWPGTGRSTFHWCFDARCGLDLSHSRERVINNLPYFLLPNRVFSVSIPP